MIKYLNNLTDQQLKKFIMRLADKLVELRDEDKINFNENIRNIEVVEIDRNNNNVYALLYHIGDDKNHPKAYFVLSDFEAWASIANNNADISKVVKAEFYRFMTKKLNNESYESELVDKLSKERAFAIGISLANIQDALKTLKTRHYDILKDDIDKLNEIVDGLTSPTRADNYVSEKVKGLVKEQIKKDLKSTLEGNDPQLGDN